MIIGLDHTGMMVNDLDKSIAFYKKLGFVVENCFEIEAEKGKAVTLRYGDSELELFEFEHPATPLAEMVKNHIGLVSNDIEADVEIFVKNGYEIALPVSRGTVVKKKAFVKSPEGNFIEIIEN